jgi:hypothetical protein
VRSGSRSRSHEHDPTSTTHGDAAARDNTTRTPRRAMTIGRAMRRDDDGVARRTSSRRDGVLGCARATMTTTMIIISSSFFLALVPVTYANGFKIEVAKLKINTPENVRGTYDVAIANFGRTLYGGSLSGTLTYPANIANSRQGCDASAVTIPDSARQSRGAVILMLDRGSCAFTMKVWNAQLAGADAVIIVDDRDEDLVTMDSGADADTGSYVSNITIPAVLARMVDGNSFDQAITRYGHVVGTLDWHDVLPHPDSRVEWELWSESNDECGYKCEQQNAFIVDFAPIAKQLEQDGYTQFTPHYITWMCAQNPDSRECKAQCINRGRYCAPDPDDDLSHGYSGADVVIDNLRALCVFDAANKTGTPWLWWDFVSQFASACSMDSGKFAAKSCAEDVVRKVGVDLSKVNACIGDTNADITNSILEAQISAQSPPPGSSRPDVRLLPTILINEERYSGKVARGDVLSAICSGFESHSIPTICNDAGLMHAMCVRGQDGDRACAANSNGDDKTACQETSTYPWYECVCPTGTKPVVDNSGKSTCVKPTCKSKCLDPNAKCTETTEGLTCACKSGYVTNYMPDVDDWVCLNQKRGGAGLVLTSVLMSLLVLVAVAYAFYQYRARRFMDAEIRNIMSQYMPLDQEPMDDGAYEQPPRAPREDPHGRILPMSVPLSDKF